MCSNRSRPKVLGVIPARFGSTRFPGKPLSLIHGKSLIQHTYENALRCPLLNDVVIATDDERIFDHAKNFGAQVTMTCASHANGTERIGEIVGALKERPDIVVNIQGDEPCISPEVIESLINALIDNPDVPMSTVITRLDAKDAANPSVVKCVTDTKGKALYFSRQPIPGTKFPSPTIPYFSHIGLYAYRTDFIFTYLQLPNTPLQLIEDLEQLKVLEHGFPIQTAIVEHFSLGVDSPEDIYKVETYLCKQNQQNRLSTYL